tara:strand:+ start:2811 stop:3962 length:1152 start_codon:yes stop_codon:yes gene_type:complete
MLHLFKKVYVATDNIIDVGVDRVVVSFEHGHDTLEDMKKVMGGELITFAQDWSKLIGSKNTTFMDTADIFDKLGDHCDATGKRVVIYCDNKALCTIMALWFKTIFKKTNKAAAVDLLESMIFKYKVFNRGRFSSNNGNTDVEHEIDISNFGKIFEGAQKPSAEKRKKFLDLNKGSLSLEPVLATYLSSGKMKKELKGIIKILVKKDLEKYLYELKEIFFAHILTQRFTKDLNLEKVYDFTNYDEILKDKSEFPSLFLNEKIWKTPYMNVASSGKNINFHAITKSDIKSFAKWNKISGQHWNEESIYEFIKSDVSKLDFIECITSVEMSDKQLNMILETEATYEHAAGSFFSIDLETVNSYFVQSLLDAYLAEDKKFTDQYAIM